MNNGDFEPESEFGRACGLRMQSFEPGWGFRRELRGSNGIENGDFEPGSEILKGCGLRKPCFDPEKGFRRGVSRGKRAQEWRF